MTANNPKAESKKILLPCSKILFKVFPEETEP